MNPDISSRAYIATISSGWEETAKKYGLGVELDHYCQAENLEGPKGQETDALVGRIVREYDVKVLHAPFNELFPAAIDPRARQLALDRLEQAYEKAARFGIKKMVVHSGFVPFVYFPVWHVARSVEFWTEFLDGKPADFQIAIENVLDDKPDMLLEIVKGINAHFGEKRAGICLDIGHAAVASDLPAERWTERCLEELIHMHIHNNDGKNDLHKPLYDGVIDPEYVLRTAAEADTTFTLEIIELGDTMRWLREKGFIS